MAGKQPPKQQEIAKALTQRSAAESTADMTDKKDP